MTTPTHDTTSPTREEVSSVLWNNCFANWDAVVTAEGNAFTPNLAFTDALAEHVLALYAPALAAAEKRGMERALIVATKAWPLAHTYTSENASTYIAQDHAVQIVVNAIRAEMEKM